MLACYILLVFIGKERGGGFIVLIRVIDDCERRIGYFRRRGKVLNT
jgi:hypothetical protein